MEVTTKKQNRRKIVIGVLIAVVVLVATVIAFASSYLVNYAIGRSGDGGDREVALDVEAPTDGVEQLIAENRAVQKQANEEFLQQNPGQTVQITAADGLRLNGVYYPNAVGDCPARLPRQPYRRDQPGPALLRCRLPGADP